MNIIKPREYPLALYVLDTLASRLCAGDHRQEEIADERGKAHAGFKGEESIDYYLNFANDIACNLFHGLRIPWENGHYFQMDTLVITPHFISIVEVKNMAGKLHFDQTAKQLIRMQNGIEEGFPYPLLQVKRQAQQLEMYLRSHGYPQIPIIPLVIISKTSTIITTNHSEATFYDQVMHAENLPKRLLDLKRQYSQICLNKIQLDKLSGMLLKAHEPLIPKYMKKFMIENHELLPGVYCEHCKQLSMVRIFGWWKCIKCHRKNKRAHQRSLFEYFLLIGPHINNRQFRYFTNLQSITIASQLISRLKFPYSGTYRDRVYQMDYNNLRQIMQKQQLSQGDK